MRPAELLPGNPGPPPSTRASLDRWLLLFMAAFILAIFAWLHGQAIVGSKEHATYGAFVISGHAASQHRDPYAIWPGVWPVWPYRHHTGPIVYDRNLQPPIMLPAFQLFARIPLARGLLIWTVGSLLILIAGTAALMVMFAETMSWPLILLILLSEATLGNFVVGEDFALFFAFSAGAVLALKAGREWIAAICIGALVAVHPNFGLWPVFLFLTGHRPIALRSAAVAIALTVLPLFFYGPGVYAEMFRAIATDNHSWVAGDVSAVGFFTRAGHRTVGFVISILAIAGLCAAIFRRPANPITVGGLACCAGILFAPLGWYCYLVVVYPCMAVAKMDRFAMWAAALMFLWDHAGMFSGHGFIGHLGSIQFEVATILFLISLYRQVRLTPVAVIESTSLTKLVDV